MNIKRGNFFRKFPLFMINSVLQAALFVDGIIKVRRQSTSDGCVKSSAGKARKS
jgi:hypothetical protein